MSRRVLIDASEDAPQRMQLTKVTLEELIVQDDSKPGQYVLAVIGKARILNLAFEKSAFARVTFNRWASYRDYTAVYTKSSEDGLSDIFAFGFVRRDRRPVDVEFALSCVQDGKQYWDNNSGKNYCFHLREDPLTDPEPTQDAEPEIVTTWRSPEESFDQKEDEIIFDTSSYPHFQAHPLTPTKIQYFSSLKNAPEKEVVPMKAQNFKHVHAFNSLAMESLLGDEEPVGEEETAATADGEQIEAVLANTEECEITLTVTETSDSVEEGQVVIDSDGNDATAQIAEGAAEEAIQPIVAPKAIVDETDDDILGKLEQGNDVMKVEVQITEEPATTGNAVANSEAENQLSGGTSNDAQQSQEANIAMPTPANVSGGQTKEDKTEDKKKKGKKDKKNLKKEKAASSKKEAVSSDMKNGDEQSVSSRKEKIENEETPKKKKKGFLSNMAWCGKAEPD